MIPNKIYFPADGLPRYIDWDGSPIRTKQVEDSDVCYIRKDALMEWLNAKANDYGHTTPFRIAIQCTIEKLNSM